MSEHEMVRIEVPRRAQIDYGPGGFGAEFCGAEKIKAPQAKGFLGEARRFPPAERGP